MPITRSTGKGRNPSTETKPSSSSAGTTATTAGTSATGTSSSAETTATTTGTSATETSGETSYTSTSAGTVTTAYTETSAATQSSVPRSVATEATGTTAKHASKPAAGAGPGADSRIGQPHRDTALREEQRTIVPGVTEKDRHTLPGQVGGAGGSTRSRSKSHRIAKAKEELLRFQVELAAARLAAIETEDSDEEDAVSVYSQIENDAQIDSWLANQAPPAILAITNEPHHVPQVEPIVKPLPAPGGAMEEQEQQQYSRPAHRSQELPAGASTQPDFSQLASAITLAVKAAQRPKFIELPTFNGSHQEWLSFRASYFETEQLHTTVENINRLRRNLRGKAREAVESLLITNTHPTEIMKTLESRFGRPESIAMLETDTLRNLPRLNESPRDICIYSTKVSNAVSTLRALGCIYYLYDPGLTRDITEKFVPTIRYRYYDFAAALPKEEPGLLKIEKFLKREAEICGPYAQPESIASQHSQSNQQRRPQKINTVTEKRSTSRCPVCDEEGHTTADCEKFKTANSSSRWDIAKNRHLCFRCLRYRNKTHSCRPTVCGIDSCKYTHSKLLHFVRTTEKPAEKTDNSDSKATEAINSAWTSARKQSYLKIIPVRATGPAGTVNTFALLDDGSTVTLIDHTLAESIGAKGPIDPLRIEAINDLKTAESKSRRVNITLHGSNGREERVHARTVKNFHVSAQEVSKIEIEGCKHLHDISNSLTYENAKPQILIGQDNCHLLLTSSTRKGNRNQPVASLTPLGWVLHGSHTRTLGRSIDFVSHVAEPSAEENLEDLMKQYFALDTLCINPKKPQSDPEEQALRILTENTVHTKEGRYETALLWTKENIALPDNYNNSLKRLLNIEKKIDRDPQLKQKYIEQMEGLVTKGYAEPAPEKKTQNKTWYLPHFAVVNPMKPEKLRVVHDAAAKTKGVALNDLLLKGPDLLQSLPGVVMRFRQHAIAVTADIKEMFMQVKLRAEDRDALRYLWRKDRRDDKPPEEYRMTSLIFGASCSPSTAIYVKDLNAKRFEKTNPEAAAAIINKHYVDDYLDSFKNIEDAKRITKDVREIHSQACFELKQWKSNSSQLLEALGEKEPTEDIELYMSEKKTERVLGLIWKPNTDELTFNLNMARIPPSLIEDKKPTKREALRIAMSLFDPLGFVSPITIRAKQILQEVWRRGTPWDSEIDDDLAEQWRNWTMHLNRLCDVTIPRRYLHYSDAISLQLHVFTDASESAYSTVLFWRATAPNGEVKVSLIIAKARVAPLKLTSIPRLELQAAVMGSRLAKVVTEEHERKPDSTTFWTDSKTVLTWIRTGSRSYKPYVAHRLADIEENSTVNEWRWIPTKQNVADDATRDVPTAFSKTHRWFTGPDFLYQSEDSWPMETPASMELAVTEQTGEERVHHIATDRQQKLSEALPDALRFSNWNRLRYATARVLQFIQLCRPAKQMVHYKRTQRNASSDPDWKRSATKPKTAQRSEQRC